MVREPRGSRSVLALTVGAIPWPDGTMTEYEVGLRFDVRWYRTPRWPAVSRLTDCNPNPAPRPRAESVDLRVGHVVQIDYLEHLCRNTKWGRGARVVIGLRGGTGGGQRRNQKTAWHARPQHTNYNKHYECCHRKARSWTEACHADCPSNMDILPPMFPQAGRRCVHQSRVTFPPSFDPKSIPPSSALLPQHPPFPLPPSFINKF